MYLRVSFILYHDCERGSDDKCLRHVSKFFAGCMSSGIFFLGREFSDYVTSFIIFIIILFFFLGIAEQISSVTVV